MFSISRRTTTVALLAATASLSGIAASPASAHAAAPTSAIGIAQPAAEPVGLLLPAVQSAREAASRLSCSR